MTPNIDAPHASDAPDARDPAEAVHALHACVAALLQRVEQVGHRLDAGDESHLDLPSLLADAAALHRGVLDVVTGCGPRPSRETVASLARLRTGVHTAVDLVQDAMARLEALPAPRAPHGT